MPVFKLARYEVRPEARDEAERAMHELASYIRRELRDSSWTTYRDPDAPTHYMSLTIADSPAAEQKQQAAAGTKAFLDAMQPLLVGEIDVTAWQLVTSSDLARRRR
jgi:quinol monooxygenase YgiN